MKTLKQIWLEEFIDRDTKLCALCQNKGTLNCKDFLVRFCICPNGRKMKKQIKTLRAE